MDDSKGVDLKDPNQEQNIAQQIQNLIKIIQNTLNPPMQSWNYMIQ